MRKTLAGISRTNGRPKKKAKALPIEDLELIVAALAGLGRGEAGDRQANRVQVARPLPAAAS